MTKKLVTLAAFFGFIAIILGAFGAHGLKKVLTEAQLISFETGVKYQMYHALFLLLIAQLSILTDKNKRTIGILTTVGVFLFSGSIYLLATQALTGINFKFLGPITPVGGMFLITSWFFTAFYSMKQKNNK
ncbi:DUF423 domain-containing protein [Myroides sp. JBRI-B21084]|uniref:DUF423 domain-containing protein n=1 Tax=Myroides sp. JBRI-B21084 TaxID=3119977 RepID=UPI0026E39BFD|nr:DUF423 domain-containing protein [Paenimyroides cloacae]WKW47048.1 DUF423 domain-containing protein [Paenimyroides cloacae]